MNRSADQEGNVEQAEMDRVLLEVPTDAELSNMTYMDLANNLSLSRPNSARFHVLDRQMRRILAEDQMLINRKNTYIAGFVSLLGVALGWLLRGLGG
jgi:hypothetical protein